MLFIRRISQQPDEIAYILWHDVQYMYDWHSRQTLFMITKSQLTFVVKTVHILVESKFIISPILIHCACHHFITDLPHCFGLILIALFGMNICQRNCRISTFMSLLRYSDFNVIPIDYVHQYHCCDHLSIHRCIATPDLFSWPLSRFL